MPTSPLHPHILKGGIVLIHPDTGAPDRIISLQYNPETITRSLAVPGSGGNQEGGGATSAETLRLTGPPVETYKLEAEIDATDQLEFAKNNDEVLQVGIQPILSALEMIVYPSIEQLTQANDLARQGSLEIIAMESALSLFIWNRNRIVPVKITELSITEEFFDIHLNPIRAKVTLGMRVLSIDDLGFEHKGGSLYMNYQRNKKRLADLYTTGTFRDLGINSQQFS